jgi:predicted alpha/beta-hydrolase family hydrolase
MEPKFVELGELTVVGYGLPHHRQRPTPKSTPSPGCGTLQPEVLRREVPPCTTTPPWRVLLM